MDQFKLRNHNRDDVLGFRQVDQTFDSMGFTENLKMTIYQRLAAILHLNEIKYEETPDTEVEVVESSVKHIVIAAELLELSFDELKEALLYTVMSVAGSEIM